jgi:hypothetical protein
MRLQKKLKYGKGKGIRRAKRGASDKILRK